MGMTMLWLMDPNAAKMAHAELWADELFYGAAFSVIEMIKDEELKEYLYEEIGEEGFSHPAEYRPGDQSCSGSSD